MQGVQEEEVGAPSSLVLGYPGPFLRPVYDHASSSEHIQHGLHYRSPQSTLDEGILSDVKYFLGYSPEVSTKYVMNVHIRYTNVMSVLSLTLATKRRRRSYCNLPSE